VFIERDAEPELYRETFEEAQRLIRVSEPVRLSAESVVETPPAEEHDKLTTSRLARALKMANGELSDRLVHMGLLIKEQDQLRLTEEGKAAGGEFRFSKRHGPYFLWPKDLKVT